MNQKRKRKHAGEPTVFVREIGNKATRKLKARRNATPGVWYGLGMMGLIGWSIAIPTLLGAAIGVWLDKQQWSERSWTLALLVTGLTIGCFNAWLWVSKEQNAMVESEENDNE